MKTSFFAAFIRALAGTAYSSWPSVVVNSVVDLIHKLDEHAHSAGKVYPTEADGVTLVADNAAPWSMGALVQVVPASTITSDFDIHHIAVERISAVGAYEIVLTYGAGDTECGRVRVVKSAVMESVGEMPFQSPIIPANSVVKAKVASSTGNLDEVDISLHYHTY